MKKTLCAATIALAAVATGVAPAAAAPKGLPGENPNPNSLIIPVQCEGFDDPFLIWVPNGKAVVNNGTPVVGHPIGVDVSIGIQKTEKHGSFARTIECDTPIGPVNVMPTGKPAS
jgi:hypothetical protein